MPRSVKLKAFQKFKDTTEVCDRPEWPRESVLKCLVDLDQAVSAAAALVEGSLEDGLKKFLNKYIVKKELSDEVQQLLW